MAWGVGGNEFRFRSPDRKNKWNPKKRALADILELEDPHLNIHMYIYIHILYIRVYIYTYLWLYLYIHIETRIYSWFHQQNMLFSSHIWYQKGWQLVPKLVGCFTYVLFSSIKMEWWSQNNLSWGARTINPSPLYPRICSFYTIFNLYIIHIIYIYVCVIVYIKCIYIYIPIVSSYLLLLSSFFMR
jgi:hypothetical protein